MKVTLRAAAGFDFAKLIERLPSVTEPPVVRDTHAVITIPEEQRLAVEAQLRKIPEVAIVGYGHRMELFKEVGRPADVARRFELPSMGGTHGIGHTRMATESAVTTQGAHPFSTGVDECLVHNGSLSNHNKVRRDLVREGLAFQTDNDSEVAAGYMTWKMRQGARLTKRWKRRCPCSMAFILRDRNRKRLWRVARSDRLQACRHGRNRSLGGVRHGVSRAGRSARHRQGQGLGAGARQGVYLGAALMPTFDLARSLDPGIERCTA